MNVGLASSRVVRRSPHFSQVLVPPNADDDASRAICERFFYCENYN